jgi:uncharacterized protein YpmS
MKAKIEVQFDDAMRNIKSNSVKDVKLKLADDAVLTANIKGQDAVAKFHVTQQTADIVLLTLQSVKFGFFPLPKEKAMEMLTERINFPDSFKIDAKEGTILIHL